jgi:diguanylate cyclase (GGDEF)-like protein/PAS domain S-box-containing protein
MKSRNVIRPSMRSWLMALAFVAMLPVLVFALYALDKLGKQNEAAQLEELQRRNQSLQLMLNAQVDAGVKTLRILAQSEAALRGDYRALYAYAKRVLADHPGYRAVTLADGTGRMVFHTSIPYGGPTFPSAYPELIQQALQTGQPNVSGRFTAPISAKPVVAITLPLTVQGKTDHTLRIIILAETLRETLRHFPLPEGWVAALVDRQGTIIARTLLPEKFEGQPASAQFREAIRQQKEGYFQTVSLEGVTLMNTMFSLHRGEWIVGMGVPIQTLYAPRAAQLREMALLAVVWVAVSFVVAQLLANYLVRQTRISASHLTGQKDSEEITIRVAEIWKMFHHAQDAQRQAAQATQGLHVVQAERDQVQDLYDQAPCGYHSLDKEGRIVQINNTELEWLGRSREEVLGRSLADFLTEPGKAAFQENLSFLLENGHIRDREYELVHKDGSTLPVVVSATAIRDAEGQHVVSRSTVFDITERKLLEQKLERLARTDVLTGLANRREFYERCEVEIARSRRFTAPLSVMVLDADHFKRINDQHGHAAGDLVLKQISQVCRTVLRETDLLARLGGEEFGVLMPQTTLARAAEVAQRLRLALAAEVVAQPDSPPLSITVSIGVSQLAVSDPDIDALLKRADAALYRAKAAGRNQVVWDDQALPPA